MSIDTFVDHDQEKEPLARSLAASPAQEQIPLSLPANIISHPIVVLRMGS